MPYTVTDLITRAYYLSSVVTKDAETPSGDQLKDGLSMLNAVLAFKTANQRLIPYFTEYNFTAVIGQEKYFVPDLILGESLTFTLDTVRYSMILKTRREYFGSPRANDVLSLPGIYHIERELFGSNIYIYFLPDQQYIFTLKGKFSLSNVTLNQDLSITMDAFYIDYLRYALAEYICQEYNITFQQQAEKKLSEFESMLVDISPIDMSMVKFSSLQTKESLNYGQINIGKGYTPY